MQVEGFQPSCSLQGKNERLHATFRVLDTTLTFTVIERILVYTKLFLSFLHKSLKVLTCENFMTKLTNSENKLEMVLKQKKITYWFLRELCTQEQS